MYKQALETLEDLGPTAHRTLKLHQYLVSYSGLLKLKRDLRRYLAESPLR
jgi:anaphase-promoting complex subunit 5